MCVAAVNFPSHRGTATAFPLAAFGLSAFFFSGVSAAISSEAQEFLLVMLIGTVAMTSIPILLLRTSPPPTLYTSVPAEAPRATRLDSRSSLKPKSPELSKKRENSLGSGTQYAATDSTYSSSSSLRSPSAERLAADRDKDPGQGVGSCTEPSDESARKNLDVQPSTHHSLYADVRGFAMLKYSECYELFLLIGLMTGIGLMTIK